VITTPWLDTLECSLGESPKAVPEKENGPQSGAAFFTHIDSVNVAVPPKAREEPVLEQARVRFWETNHQMRHQRIRPTGNLHQHFRWSFCRGA
jgi:hypothetical protein